MEQHIEKANDLIGNWQNLYDELWSVFGPCFPCKDTCRHAERYVLGLLGRIERKNGWQLAEYLGDKSPAAIQNFLGRAAWDAKKFGMNSQNMSKNIFYAPVKVAFSLLTKQDF